MRRSYTIEAAKEEAEKLGAKFSYEKGGKRWKAKVSINNKYKTISISIEACNPRVLLNIKEDVRRAVREMSN